MTHHTCQVKTLGPITIYEPEYGDLSLKVYPINHGEQINLPPAFKPWSTEVFDILSGIPIQPHATKAFVTIESRWFSVPDTLRREGVHMDGNFCADPTFRKADKMLAGWGGTWSGIRAVKNVECSDNSHVEIGFSIPYDIGIIPIGKYVSNDLGATIVATSYEGCHAWPGQYRGSVGEGGDFSNMADQLGEPIMIPANQVVAMTSNTPHQSLVTPAGVRRTLIRITMPHNWDNRCLF
jgi:hypothetical protein